jgi:selenide,water dikinase
VLRPLQNRFRPEDYPDLLIGLGQPDDAAVYRLSDRHAIVQTVDFFTPVVDDPYAYGAIAAANAMSDVYAMGGEVLFALNIAALPDDMPGEVVSEILRGGADKVAEAGAVIAGGHTIKDREPKYGLCVTGVVNPAEVMAKGGAKPGDLLVLTKPLGVGVVTTAIKQDLAQPEHVDPTIASMSRLNRDAARAARDLGARGGTDITGFGLIGHAWEMAHAAGVRFRFWWEALPFLPGALEYGRDWVFPGGAATNEATYQLHVQFDPALEPWQRMMLFDPETSGGLLIAIAASRADALANALKAGGDSAFIIGEVVEGSGIVVTQQAP